MFLPLYLFIILLPRAWLAVHGSTQLDYYCYSGNTYITGDPYETNLNLLLTSLVDNARVDTLYVQDIKGEPPYQVYGYSICTTMSVTACQSCLQTTIDDVLVVCANKKSALAIMSGCWLSYSDYNNIGTALPPPGSSSTTTNNNNNNNNTTTTTNNSKENTTTTSTTRSPLSVTMIIIIAVIAVVVVLVVVVVVVAVVCRRRPPKPSGEQIGVPVSTFQM